MASLAERESSFCDKSQNNAIIRALYDQKHSSTFCDVIMKVCGREIYAHSNVLAAASPYFNAFLSQDLPRQFSQRSPQVIEIQIDGSEPNMMYEEAVSNVIDFIYTGRMTVRPSNVSQISEIARIMQMDNIVRFCEDFFQGRTLSGETYSPPGGEGASVYVDVSVNTDNMVTGHLDTVPMKLKAGKLLSVSSQVTPLLLGIEPRPKQFKEEKTQTSERDFPDKKEKKKSFLSTPGTGRRPGRPRKYPILDDSVEKEKTTFQESEQDIIETNSENIPVNSEEQFEEEQELLARTDGSTSEMAMGNLETLEETAAQPAKVKEEKKLDEDNSSGLRRSRRTPKPTPKLKGALKRKASLSPMELTSLEVHLEEEILLEDEEPKPGPPVVVEPVEVVTPRKGKGRSPKKQHFEEVEKDQIEPEEKGEVENLEPEAEYCQDIEEEVGRKHVFTTRKGRRKMRLRGRRAFYKHNCDSCGFSTNKVREMANHRKLHKLEQNICYYCEQQYDNRDDLNDHMEKHKGPTPYYCPVCDLRFRTRTQLNLHLPKHSDDKPFICEVCSMGFKWKHALKNHMVVHSNKKDHLCDVCGYATAHKSQLKAHKLIHTGLTYKCDFPGCTFQATKRQNLKYHLLTHTREKPHQCEICGQNFSLVKNLRRHMLLHSTDKPHACVQCEFATTRFDKLKEHLLKQHGFGSPPEKRVRITDLVRQNAITQLLGPSVDGTQHAAFVKIEQVAADSDEAVHTQEILAIEEAADSMSSEAVIGTTIATENGDPKTMELLPGQTIIITQPGEDGEMQEIAIPVSAQSTVMEGSSAETLEGDYTEVMIPMSQVAEYVQHVTYVTQ